MNYIYLGLQDFSTKKLVPLWSDPVIANEGWREAIPIKRVSCRPLHVRSTTAGDNTAY